MADHYDLAIRFDGVDSTELIKYLEKDTGSFIVVKEIAEGNPHFHVYLRTKKKESAARAALKRAMPELNGNGSYSLAVVRDLDKYYRYMMKGEKFEVLPNVIASNGILFSTEWIQEQHDLYWDENDKLQKKRKAEPIIDVVLIKCKQLKYNWDNRELISRVYIKELVERGKAINIFSAKSAVNLLQVKLCPNDDALEDLAKNV